VQSGGFQQKGAGSQLWGTGSLIGGSGSQTRGVGSEIRWDPQFNPCIRLSVHFLSTSARLPPSIHQLNIPIVLRLLQPSSLCFPQTLPTIQTSLKTILLTGTVSSEQILFLILVFLSLLFSFFRHRAIDSFSNARKYTRTYTVIVFVHSISYRATVLLPLLLLNWL